MSALKLEPLDDEGLGGAERIWRRETFRATSVSSLLSSRTRVPP